MRTPLNFSKPPAITSLDKAGPRVVCPTRHWREGRRRERGRRRNRLIPPPRLRLVSSRHRPPPPPPHPRRRREGDVAGSSSATEWNDSTRTRNFIVFVAFGAGPLSERGQVPSRFHSAFVSHPPFSGVSGCSFWSDWLNSAAFTAVWPNLFRGIRGDSRWCFLFN